MYIFLKGRTFLDKSGEHMDNFKKNIRDQLVTLFEQEFNVSLNNDFNQKIMVLLNQLHGHSFNQGLREGSLVNKKYLDLRQELLIGKGMKTPCDS